MERVCRLLVLYEPSVLFIFTLIRTFELSGFPPAQRGVPQIEVSFDVDANGILNVAAKEKSTGKISKITITNDKGRLTKNDIDRMLRHAEKFKRDDDKLKNTIFARNNLENYVYSLKSAVEGPRLPSKKISDEEKKTLSKKCNETAVWLEANKLAKKHEYDKKFKEVSNVCGPIANKFINFNPQTTTKLGGPRRR